MGKNIIPQLSYEFIRIFGQALLFFLLIYFLITSITWQARNPKANSATIFTHFVDVITFKKCLKFQ